MQILNLASRQKADCVPDGAIFLLGYFDGVHLGHRSLVDRAAKIGAKDTPIVIWTFTSLPKSSAERGVLTTNEEKCDIFAALGADYVIFEDFSSVRDLSGEDFFERCIAVHSPLAVVCGFDFKFGKGAAYTPTHLTSLTQKHGIECAVLPEFSLGDRPVSSTEIRRLISCGKIDDANELLGYRYYIRSTVNHGKEIGRQIGFPTINQTFPAEKVLPAHGVYAVRVEFNSLNGSKSHIGICNVGSRPTVNDDKTDVTVETYIADFCGDLYDTEVKTSFCHYLRGETRFSSLEELSAQINNDKENALALLSTCEK